MLISGGMLFGDLSDADVRGIRSSLLRSSFFCSNVAKVGSLSVVVGPPLTEGMVGERLETPALAASC